MSSRFTFVTFLFSTLMAVSPLAISGHHDDRLSTIRVTLVLPVKKEHLIHLNLLIFVLWLWSWVLPLLHVAFLVIKIS